MRTPGPLDQASHCAIGRAVIDKNDFVAKTGERRRQFRLQNRDVLFLVEERDDHGNRRATPLSFITASSGNRSRHKLCNSRSRRVDRSHFDRGDRSVRLKRAANVAGKYRLVRAV